MILRNTRAVLPQTLHDLQVKLFTDCLTICNKLMMNRALPIIIKKIIKKIKKIIFPFERL
jgi:hypothetical protein